MVPITGLESLDQEFGWFGYRAFRTLSLENGPKSL